MITIRCKLGTGDALQRLDRLLTSAAKTYALAGKRNGSTFTLMRAQRVGNSLLRPQLYGTVEPAEGGCFITGQFGLARGLKVALGGWFAFCGLWTVAAIFAALRAGPASLWLLPAVGVALLFLGVLFVRFARSYYYADRDWLVRLLSEELSA